jgi:hypothetical protein
MSNSDGIWLLRGRILFALGQGENTLAACSRSIELSEQLALYE